MATVETVLHFTHTEDGLVNVVAYDEQDDNCERPLISLSGAAGFQTFMTERAYLKDGTSELLKASKFDDLTVAWTELLLALMSYGG